MKQADLAPNTQPANPDEQHTIHTLPVFRKVAGVRVTEDTALTYSAVFACVRVISEDIASLPWHVFETRKDARGKDRVPKDPADWLLSIQANPETSAYHFRETLIGHALTWGNGYAEIERDNAGRPAWLWQLTPDRVDPARVRSTGELVYDVANDRAPNTVLRARDTFHLKGLGFDGLRGYSVINMASRTIGRGLALDETSTHFYENDSTPGGYLKHPGRLSEDAQKQLRENFQNIHQGPKRRRVIGILCEGMEYKQTSIPPEDAQLIQQMQFQPEEICRWFRIMPQKIAHLLRLTFNNVEQLSIDHVTDTLTPWARRLESEGNIKLFGPVNIGRRYTKINFKGRLRGDTAAQTGFYTSMLDRGVFSINDVRELEDANPVPNGDKRFVPLNMQLLDNAGEQPSLEPSPVSEPTPPDEQDSEPVPTTDRQSFDSVALFKAIESCLQKEANSVRGFLARFKGKESEYADWVDGKLTDKVRENFFRLVGSALDGVQKVGVALLYYWEQIYLEEMKRRALGVFPSAKGCGTWPKQQTHRIVEDLSRHLRVALAVSKEEVSHVC